MVSSQRLPGGSVGRLAHLHCPGKEVQDASGEDMWSTSYSYSQWDATSLKLCHHPSCGPMFTAHLFFLFHCHLPVSKVILSSCFFMVTFPRPLCFPIVSWSPTCWLKVRSLLIFFLVHGHPPFSHNVQGSPFFLVQRSKPINALKDSLSQVLLLEENPQEYQYLHSKSQRTQLSCLKFFYYEIF